MNKKQLRKTANDFVKGFGKVERMCFFLSLALQGFLSSKGTKTKLINGLVNIGNEWYGHYWLELENGEILDSTAGQFKNPISLKVFLGRMPDNYFIGEFGQGFAPTFGTRTIGLKEIFKELTNY